jgi:hypothetical protein
MELRKKLADILQLDGGRDTLKQVWDQTEAASDFTPLPAGDYTCRVQSGEPFNAPKKGTPGYKLTFEVTEGEHAGRRVWHDLWLTGPALPMTKRDLAKLGVTRLEQLDQPLPVGILVRVKLALRRDDDGNEHNKVRSFESIGIEPGDTYAPAEDAPADKPAGVTEPERDDPGGSPPALLPDASPESNGIYSGGKRRR